ncbi:MAG TPA: SdrD B-like domain-containing protein [Saprospiraceae bacterium]|nr:SdrD B-like domain-containing protein [Saprospiraceae bacterium]
MKSTLYSFQKMGLVCALVLFGALAATAQSGTAFRDFNGDGTQTGAEPGVEGITVKIYGDAALPAKDQFIGETRTDANGNFNFTTLVLSGRAALPGEKVRIEFSIPTSYGCDLAEGVDYTALGGLVYGSSVQFITGLQSGVKFAINYPGQWVEDPDPLIMLPCYSFGDPNAGGDAGSKPAFVSYDFSENGIPQAYSGGYPGVPMPNMLATIGQVGSLYGVAFSRSAQKVFTSAVMRRHAAFGPLGPGGIYLIDPINGGVTNWLDLDAVGIWTWDHNLNAYPPNPGNNTSPVTGFIGTSAQRGLAANSNQPSTDYAAGDQVGKVSIGDIDISDDGRYLYVMNLWTRKIYEIDLVDPANPQAPTLGNVGSRVRSWDAPDPGTINPQGEHRPWGLKYYRGKLYVGTVLSGQNLAGNVVSPVITVGGQYIGTELRGYVHEFDPVAETFTVKINFDFNYGREADWIPWGYSINSPLSRYFSGPEREIAEPILADIEFDDTGNMLIGVLDRKGHQYAINNNDYNGNLIFYEYSTAGELLRADANNNCVYSIVSKPGTADYYDDNIIHPESLQGPLAVLPGQNEAVAVVLDPIAIRSGGTIRFKNTTGAKVANSAYEVFDDRETLGNQNATPSKANGLGDVELTGDPAPIEVGNRVWMDMDRDGIQDSGEPGIPGVEVVLKWSNGNILATTTTNGTGNYVFNEANVPDGDPNTPGNQEGLLYSTNYKICIPSAEFGNGQPLNNFKVTTSNQSGTGLVDYSDNDGIQQPNGDVEIAFTSGVSGETNHTLDFGLIGTDYGDAPNTYGTTEGSNGAWHWIRTDLKLGACVDGETDGQPEPMAGLMAGGDDNNAGLGGVENCGGNGDDENGIVFNTPMIPGSQACITINAMNMTGSNAHLQAWVDFNGNGIFEISETLTNGGFAGGSVVVPNGGLTNHVACFDVPATATFQGGAAFVRFRLSPSGGLTPTGGNVDGEVEDYKVPLAKIGTLVWNDYNNNGVQDEAANAGINGVTMNLTWLGPDGAVGGGDDKVYTATTALMGGTDGTYMFLGLTSGMYKIAPAAPAGYVEGREDLGGNDNKDGDDHAGVMVVINNPINLLTGENGTGDVPGGTNGFPDNQDNLSFDFNYVAVDYGDAPNTYGTTLGSNGPCHIANPNLKLGNNVDGDPDGQPDSMAGLMTGGDDNDADGDDEDGITVSGPMIPGQQACFIVNAMNMTGSAAKLQAWVDFNGDGQFQPTEELNSGDFAGGANVPNGGLTNAKLCFNVPAAATFQGGQAMMRFRLSQAGGLNATGIPPSGIIPAGEVEDYKVTLAKVGTYVWNDYNNNGIQDEAASAGLNGITVNLTWLGPNGVVGGGDDVVYTTTTSTMGGNEGQYMILGLTSGMYKLSIPSVPASFQPTLLNVGSDVTDADDPTGVMVSIPNPIVLPTGENGTGDTPGGTNGFPDAQDDLTYDFGYIQRDYGDLPDTYGTTSGSGGPSSIVDPNLKLGACVDAENNGNPEPMAGAMSGGDDNSTGANVDGGTSNCGDDEDGIQFITPLIPGYTSCVKVTAMNTTGAAAKLQAWMDFNGNGTFEASEQLSTGDFAPSGANVPVGGLTGATLCFDVPQNATFQGGKAMVRFRLSPNGGLTPGGNGPNGEVEDYKVALAKIGNLVWTDYNNDGQQNEPLSSGINGAGVVLEYAGADGDISTVADNITYTTTTATMSGTPGIYMFLGLISGVYEVSVPVAPNGAIPTVLNQGSDVTDSDDPAGIIVSVPNPIGLPLNENGMGDNPGGTNGFVDAQDNLTIDFGYVGFDYGDLPNTYGTSTSTDGPKHVVTPDLYLGACVDSEEEAFPDPMAGLMGGGDDGNPGTGTQGVCAVPGDDENGIVFETPMIPGVQACIRVTAHNNTDVTAKLQGWIDFNGNGTFDAGEELTTGDFAGGGANIPDGGVNNAKFCFNVPAGATFQGGQAMVRFRLSKNGGLGSGNPANSIPTLGEVEDYKVPLAKIGNLVWWDYDNDGVQEAGEPGINGTDVRLTFFGPNGVAGGGDDVVYNTTTSAMNGEKGVYMFLGLVPGAYKLDVVNTPSGFIPTLLNIGSDVKDSDDPAGVMVMIPNPINLPTGENGNADNPGGTNGFADNQDDLTYDFGYIAVDYGDAPNTYTTDNPSNGPKHLVNPNLYLGTCVDGENNGQPEAMAGLMTGGDDNNSTVALLGTCAGGDDENGVVLFETPMIPGYVACIRVTAVNTTGANAILQGWIDFNGNGTFEANEQLNTGGFAPAGASIPNGGVVNMQYCFDVPANATFAGGQAFSRFRLSPTGGLTPSGPAAGPFPIGEVEDYKTPLAKIGNLVWNDYDNNGQQNEPGSAGLNNIEVNLIWAGSDLAFNTPDDRTYETVTSNMGVNGQYMFWGLIPGPYKVVLPTLPANFIATQLNLGSDVSDSDNPAGEMVMIPDPIALPLGENSTGDVPNDVFPDPANNITIDFGLITRDFGDLPDTYGTTDGSPSDGSVHVVNPNLRLGTCEDGEMDGQPDSMAGLMTGGDDNNGGAAVDGTASTCGDDEDGVVFESPMVPGTQACIRVSALNTLPSAAVLQMWVDFNGDGDVADAGEAVTSGSFNGPGGGAVVPVGGLANAQLCFDVPAAATFAGGSARVRFRISPSGNLSANGPENMPFPVGETEDYKLPVAKIGNYVWNDNNNDGIQNEPGTNGLNNILVQLVWAGPDANFNTAGDNRTYTTLTSPMNGVNGQYMFWGLPSGSYKVSVPTNPNGFIPTQLNIGNDVLDADDPTGVMVMIPNPINLPVNENGTGDLPGGFNGYPDNQDDLTLDFGYVSVDYGDLPNSYNTDIPTNGPKAIVNPNLKLGASVDGELNGQPEAMAGMTTGGDDNNAGGYNEGGAGDDENGVTFLTPMIPGFQACVRVNTMNTLGGNAVLQAWIDFNGDGDVNDADEQLNTGSFAAAAPGAIVPAGASVNSDFCFDVPATATFFGGQAFVRFRLSPTGGLSSNGPAVMPYPIGEVEDYKVQLAKAGNLVWIDANVDGLQTQPLEVPLGINDVTVQLQWAGPDGNFATVIDNRTYTDITTTENGVKGKYAFCGLIPGNYRMVVPPFGYVPTLIIDANGNTQDVIDSDNPTGVNFTVPNPPTTLPTNENGIGDNPLVINGFPDNQANFTFDFGYLGFDFGDLPETYGTTQGANNPGPDGAVHTVTPDLYLGPCVDIDIDGQPEAMAGFMTGGDDGNAGPGALGTCTPLADDENGISFPTPLIPGNQACVKVTARNNTGGAAFLQAWIDFNGNGTFEANEQLTTGNFAPAGASIPNGGVTNQNFCFDVPTTATFNGGNLFARFRLSKNGGVTATGPAIPGNGQFPNGEVEDYKLPLALIGNYVWMDNPDIQGDQDATEMPLANVKLNLTWAGEDGVFQTAANSSTPAGDDRVYMTTTNANGYYEFRGMIPSSNYRILADKYTAPNGIAGDPINPVNKILTIPNLPGNDNIDSDGTPFIAVTIPNLTTVFLPTGENSLQDATNTGFPDNQANVSLDLGFIDEPQINAAMAITGFDPTVCGEFAAFMDICIENTSTAPLANLQVMLDLAGANAFGAAFKGMIGSPIVIESTAQQNPVFNNGYSGASAAPGKNLFDGNSGLLWPGEKFCFRIKFGVDPDAPGAPANPKAQAMVSGKAQNFQGVPIPDYWNGGAQYMAMDLSDVGTDPRSTNPGFVGDTGGSDDPTVLGNCWQTSQVYVCNDLVYISMDADCNALVTPSMVLEGEDPDCDEDNYPLGGFFDITITTLTGQPVPNPIPPSYFGQTLKYSAKHIMTCNSCWGNLKLEDKLAPEIECSDIHLNCAITNYTPDYLENVLGLDNARPEVFDCATYTLTNVDTWHDVTCNQSVNGNDDVSAYVERVWTAKDAWNNVSTCTQYIYFDRIHVFDIQFPADSEVSCTNGNADPSVTGVPYYEAFGIQWPLWPDAGFCEFATSYTDDPIVECDGTTKILRTWKAIDWCLPTSPLPPLFNPMYYIQVVKVVDHEGPDMACPANLTVSTDPFTCCATTNLPDITIEDNCSRINNIEAKVKTFEYYTGAPTGTHVVGGTLEDFAGNNWWDLDTLGNFGWTPCLPLGTHTVIYTAQDDCGNTATCEFQLTVADYIPPVASCDETTTVAIGGDDVADCYTPADGCDFAGVTWVKASTFNDGSHDNCNDVRFTVRRMNPYTDCINNLNHDPCYPGGQSEFDIATAELDSIKFYCCEVGTTQTIILAVYQVDVNGNLINGPDGTPVKNECMIQVEVQDKLKPFCQSPANVSVNCENFDPSLWAYGKATVADNCCLDLTKEYQGQCGLTHSVNYALFDTVCNKGTITRTFRAFDCHGQSSQCTQRVFVSYEQDYFVKFPNDVIVTVCDGTGNYGEPLFFGEDCELLGVSYEDEIFTVVPDACFKIERNWQIINWCTYDPNLPCINVPNPNPNPISNAAANLPGPTVSACGTIAPWAPTSVRINPTDPQPTNFCQFWEKNANCYRYKQIIKVVDGQAPTGTYTVPACDNQNWVTPNRSDLWNETYWWENGLQTHDLCEEPTDLSITGTDACSGSNINIEYLLFLDLDGDNVMETVVNSVNTGLAGLGWNNVLYNNLNTPNFQGGISRQFDERAVPANQKYGFAIQETVTGNNKTASVRWNTQQQQNNYVVPELPHGTHKIKWFVTDGCGNNSEYEYTFTVKDCKAPTVVCLNGLSTNIMPTGMITLWASDFLQYTEDNCTPAGLIKIGIRKCGTGTGFPVDAQGNPITQVTFNCTELGTQCVELWAIDAAGNADYCETYVIVQDNNGNCGTGNTVNVAGVLKTEMTDGVEEATVNVNGTSTFAPPYSYFDITNQEGTFELMNNVPIDATFTIAPEKDDNPLNGVTTYDLVLISKHILGLEPFNSPYKMIAADANKSGSITTFDVVELRKLVLGIYTELPNNTSWRFVDKGFVFPNANNPFQTVFPETISVANAMSHQLGEDFVGVKIGDVNNSVVANATMQAEDRTSGTAILDIEDRAVAAGEVFDVTFTAAEQLKGFQFTMLQKGLKTVGVKEEDGITAGNFGTIFEGATTVSVDGPQAFTLQMRAEKSGKLSEMLGVSGEITRAEAYSEAGRLNVAFRFDGKTVAGVGFELYQNQPNPFVNKTTIGFFLPEASEATLSIFDEAGRMVYQQKGQFLKGENAVVLDRALLNTTGVLYYQLETATDRATKKMIQAK